MLVGEVTREFEQLITGPKMYKVHFGGVLGTWAVEKEKCHLLSEGDGLAIQQKQKVATAKIPFSFRSQHSRWTYPIILSMEGKKVTRWELIQIGRRISATSREILTQVTVIGSSQMTGVIQK